MRKSKSGFTLVELAVVIVILSILIVMLVASYGAVQQRARDTKRMDDVAKIGRALQLWPSQNSQTPLSQFGAGASGAAYGWFSISNYGYTQSIKQKLISADVLKGDVKEPDPSVGITDYMVAFCTVAGDNRRVVLAQLEAPPAETVAQTVQKANCTNTTAEAWANNPSYGVNYAKVF